MKRTREHRRALSCDNDLANASIEAIIYDDPDLTPPPEPTAERVFVAVDVSNLWFLAQYAFGPNARVNYGRLKSLIQNNTTGELPRQLDLRAYTVTASARKLDNGTIEPVASRNAPFIESLQKIGYQIKNKDLYVEKGISKPFASDWDVGITVEAMDSTDTFDTFCLVSGDGDYSPLIQNLKEKEKYVEVVSFKNCASRLLYKYADRITFLTENEIFQRDPDGNK
jgi:uncharacterized LabA/DUF88 family protein